MKKLFVFIGMLLMLTLTSVEACEPAYWTDSLFIVVDDCTEKDLDSIDFDIYVRKSAVAADKIVFGRDDYTWLSIYTDIEQEYIRTFSTNYSTCTFTLDAPENFNVKYLFEEFKIDIYYEGVYMERSYVFDPTYLWGNDYEDGVHALYLNPSTMELREDDYEFVDVCAGWGNPVNYVGGAMLILPILLVIVVMGFEIYETNAHKKNDFDMIFDVGVFVISLSVFYVLYDTGLDGYFAFIPLFMLMLKMIYLYVNDRFMFTRVYPQNIVIAVIYFILGLIFI